jgi:hypothetical protein
LGSGARSLKQTLSCTSDSYNFDLRTNLEHEGGAIKGTWTEGTRSANGTISGRAGGGTIQATVDGAVFSAVLSLTTHGNQQSVSVRAQDTQGVQGAQPSQVSIVLNRAR